MVLTRIFLSDSFAATSSGASGFSMSMAPGLLWTGTLRCISTFAAADEEIGLTGCAPPCVTRGPEGGLVDPCGMTIFSPHAGQLISEPPPELSTANSWSHFGQLKTISINHKLVLSAGRH